MPWAHCPTHIPGIYQGSIMELNGEYKLTSSKANSFSKNSLFEQQWN